MTNEQLLQMVGFKLGDTSFAIPILDVQEIIRVLDIITIPNAPSFVQGVIDLRGKVIPIIGLREKLSLTCIDSDKSRERIIVINFSGMLIGFQVQDVYEVIRAENTSFEEAPSITLGVNKEYIQGLVRYHEKIFIVLNIKSVLSSMDLKLLAEGMNK